MSDPRTWRNRFDQELAMRKPACPECKMRTFHLPECSHSKLTPEERDRARARRKMIEEMERG